MPTDMHNNIINKLNMFSINYSASYTKCEKNNMSNGVCAVIC